MPSITVNLSDPGGRRYLKLGMEVEVNADVSAEIKAQGARIRDAIIMLLAGKTFNDISTPDGKVLLKAEVAAPAQPDSWGATRDSGLFYGFCCGINPVDQGRAATPRKICSTRYYVMSQDDQEALAAQWAAQLEDEADNADADGGGAAAADAEAADDKSCGAPRLWMTTLLPPSGPKLWPRMRRIRGRPPSAARVPVPAAEPFSSPTTDAQFKDMTEMSRQPRDNKLKRELDFILDIPLDVSAELGRTRLLINELLQLGQGSVVELNKLAGEPLEVYVNGKLVARGEAVVINEKFGVRLTDIISPIERVKQLG